MGVVIPLFAGMHRDCEQCVNSLCLGNGDIHCVAFNELILDPAHAAEDCPAYEMDA